jgi:hypothetical protein
MYVSTAVLLVLVGLVTLISIGFPILVLGVALLALTPVRTRPTIFRPALAGVLGFLIGLILVVPLTCSTSTSTSTTAVAGASATAGTGSTTCTSILGPEYSGSATYDPSYVPALLAGLILGAAAFVSVRAVVVRRRPSVPT